MFTVTTLHVQYQNFDIANIICTCYTHLGVIGYIWVIMVIIAVHLFGTLVELQLIMIKAFAAEALVVLELEEEVLEVVNNLGI